MPDAYIGQKVNVWFPHYYKVQRILKEDSNGLYVSYQGQRVSVRADKNCFGEVIRGRYIGIHPKLAKRLERNRIVN